MSDFDLVYIYSWDDGVPHHDAGAGSDGAERHLCQDCLSRPHQMPK